MRCRTGRQARAMRRWSRWESSFQGSRTQLGLCQSTVRRKHHETFRVLEFAIGLVQEHRHGLHAQRLLTALMNSSLSQVAGALGQLAGAAAVGDEDQVHVAARREQRDQPPAAHRPSSSGCGAMTSTSRLRQVERMRQACACMITTT